MREFIVTFQHPDYVFADHEFVWADSHEEAVVFTRAQLAERVPNAHEFEIVDVSVV